MASTPVNTPSSGEQDNTTMMLAKAFKHVTGTLNFNDLAIDMGVSNGEAMRKRLKRTFDKLGTGPVIKGDAILTGDGTATPPAEATKAKPAKTPKTAAAGGAGKKRKADEDAEVKETPGSPSPAPKKKARATKPKAKMAVEEATKKENTDEKDEENDEMEA